MSNYYDRPSFKNGILVSLKAWIDDKLLGKADKGTTLSSYGITNAYTKTETDTALAGKASASTTLEGYGITNAYTKTQTDSAINAAVATKQDTLTFDSAPTANSVNPVTSQGIKTAIDNSVTDISNIKKAIEISGTKNLLKINKDSTNLREVTFTINKNSMGECKEIVINGTMDSGNPRYLSFNSYLFLPPGTYIMTGGKTDLVKLNIYNDSFVNIVDADDTGDGIEFTVPSATGSYGAFDFKIELYPGITYDNEKIYPMIRPVGTNSGFNSYIPSNSEIASCMDLNSFDSNSQPEIAFKKNIKANKADITNTISCGNIQIKDNGYANIWTTIDHIYKASTAETPIGTNCYVTPDLSHQDLATYTEGKIDIAFIKKTTIDSTTYRDVWMFQASFIPYMIFQENESMVYSINHGYIGLNTIKDSNDSGGQIYFISDGGKIKFYLDKLIINGVDELQVADSSYAIDMILRLN